MEERSPGRPEDADSLSARVVRAARRGNTSLVRFWIKRGGPLMAWLGQFDRIEDWLANLPDEEIHRDPELLYWSGATMLLLSPAEARPRLELAFTQLSARGDSIPAFLAWAGLLDAIFLLYRDLREVDPLLEWMTAEREQRVGRLPKMPQGLVVGSALFALAFRAPNDPRLPAWRTRAQMLAEQDPVSDMGMRLSAALTLDHTWRGRLADAESLCDRVEARAAKTALSPISRVMRPLNLATLRFHQGRLDECREAARRALLESAQGGVRHWDSILHCFGIGASLSRDDLAEADRHIAAVRGLIADGQPIDEAFFREMLTSREYVAENHIGVAARTASTRELTDEKGVPYFMAVCRITGGLILFDAGLRDEGRRQLDEGIKMGRTLANPVLEWIGGLFAAHMEYATDNLVAGDAALRAALNVGRGHSLAHFFLFPRRVIVPLLDRALALDHATDYVRQLITTHGYRPERVPTRSDAWAFATRVYTFGTPRVERANQAPEPLSAQFLRQVELLTALVERGGQPTPLATLGQAIYADGVDKPKEAAIRVLGQLRERVGADCIVRDDASLALDFSRVWIDASSLAELRARGTDHADVLAWLIHHYHGHYMERIERSPLVERVRVRFADLAERVIVEAVARAKVAGDTMTLERLDARWRALFPRIFEARGLPGQ